MTKNAETSKETKYNPYTGKKVSIEGVPNKAKKLNLPYKDFKLSIINVFIKNQLRYYIPYFINRLKKTNYMIMSMYVENVLDHLMIHTPLITKNIYIYKKNVKQTL